LISTKKSLLNMRFYFYRLLIPICIGCLAACSPKENPENAQAETQPESQEVKITLAPVDSPEFPDSGLEMLSPEEEATLPAGNVTFAYEVKNYQLGTQTLDADIKQCANSAKGQHIHLILNNQPYSAHYTANFEKTLEPGHYVALSFISRSYHESLKQYGAYNLRQFTVGDAPATEMDLTAPHMFYSRPKGEYKGADAKKILLDFYLINTDLAADGNKVRATINGETFMIDSWKPYFMEGLPMGENNVKLELLDNQGNAIPGPYNAVERTFTLTADTV